MPRISIKKSTYAMMLMLLEINLLLLLQLKTGVNNIYFFNITTLTILCLAHNYLKGFILRLTWLIRKKVRLR